MTGEGSSAILRKRKTRSPCPVCRLHPSLCLCAHIPTLQTRTRLCLIVHAKELKRTTNTGLLALRALVNSEMRIRGEGREALDLADLLVPQYRSVLFFPGERSVPLTPEFVAADPRPLQLIVPDGNWRQASKVATRHPELADLPQVRIATRNLATQHLRAESTAEGMATLQAIAMAFTVAEGPEIGAKLMELYELKLRQTLIGRGKLPRSTNEDGS